MITIFSFDCWVFEIQSPTSRERRGWLWNLSVALRLCVALCFALPCVRISLPSELRHHLRKRAQQRDAKSDPNRTPGLSHKFPPNRVSKCLDSSSEHFWEFADKGILVSIFWSTGKFCFMQISYNIFMFFRGKDKQSQAAGNTNEST